MSKYTTEVRYICEHYAGLSASVGYLGVSEVINMARPKVFDFSYPIFDENYRSVLETKILKHYYTREIGLETAGLWKLKLETKLNEIMPYYNQLYKSELIEFNPLYEVDLTTDHTRHNNGTRDNTGSSNTDSTTHTTGNNTQNVNGTSVGQAIGNTNGTAWDMFSDTPQGGLDGIDANTYLTNARKNTENTDTTSNTNSTVNNTTTDNINSNTDFDSDVTSRDNTVYADTVTYLEHVVGKRGSASYSKMLEEYRDTFLNIDMMIIDELHELFLNLW